jgi:hypothetical protein
VIHHTRVEDVIIYGWAPLTDELECTILAPQDAAHELDDGTKLFARLDYDEHLAVAKAHGARLITAPEVDILRRVGFQLMPYLGTPTAENDIVHSIRHDADVWRQLRARGWDGKQLVIGDGKYFVDGAPAGKSRLKGWDKDGPGPGSAWWQPDASAHNRRHFDDGTTAKYVRPRTSGGGGGILTIVGGAIGRLLAPIRALGGHLLAPRRLGLRALDVAREEHRRGVRELPGPRHSPDIQRYHAGARRGGGHTAGMLGDRSGVVVLGASASDETEWCASSASWCTAQAITEADRVPHGYRCSVREIVEDARALGTLHLVGAGYEPHVGDLAIQERVSGESPLQGGRGHVSRVSELDGRAVVTLGGNENNTWLYTRHERPFKRIVAWVEVR